MRIRKNTIETLFEKNVLINEARKVFIFEKIYWNNPLFKAK